MNQIKEVWKVATALLKAGYSVIGTHDATPDGKGKNPIHRSTKEYQTTRISEAELWEEMDRKNSSSIGVLCGKISNNLYCLDIDTKYYAGFEAILFKAIQDIFPHLWNEMRIHKTVSGGYHIIYHCTEEVGGSEKLAERMVDGKKHAFIETRGEGGYFIFPPSVGYEIHKKTAIPTFTIYEHNALLELCRSFNEVMKVAPAPRATASEKRFYTTNPFEDFNNNCDPDFITEFGYTPTRNSNAKYLYYTRPGKKHGVSISFNRETRCFYNFTSSGELEDNRGYNPATILSILKFNKDNKELYKFLVAEGYGEVKKVNENRIVHKAVVNKEPIPPNFSKEAKKQYEELKKKYEKEHSHGTFWELNDKGKAEIISFDLAATVKSMGFFKLNNKVIVKVVGRLAYKITWQEMFSDVIDYVFDDNEDVRKSVIEAVMRYSHTYHATFISTLMEQFDEDRILTDTIDTCWKAFNNTIVEITPDEIKHHNHEDIKDLLWADKIVDRNYPFKAKGSDLYKTFLTNSTGYSDHVKLVVGYLCHDFKSEAAGYLVVMQEKVIDPLDGGGSGKNLFGNILKPVISMRTVPGSMVKFDDKFFAAWNGERVYFLADLPDEINWRFLKEMASGEGYVNKKYVGEYTVAPENMAKMLFNTNYSYEELDGGLKRRIIPIEFSDYYTVNGGVDAVHGKMFPHGFTDEDWKGYFDVIFECIQAHLKNGAKLEKPELSDIGWEKKFKNQFGEFIYNFFESKITDWIALKNVPAKQFRSEYEEEASANGIRCKASPRKLLDALEDYCKRKEVEVEKNKSIRLNSIPTSCHVFESDAKILNDNDEEDYPF